MNHGFDYGGFDVAATNERRKASAQGNSKAAIARLAAQGIEPDTKSASLMKSRSAPAKDRLTDMPKTSADELITAMIVAAGQIEDRSSQTIFGIARGMTYCETDEEKTQILSDMMDATRHLIDDPQTPLPVKMCLRKADSFVEAAMLTQSQQPSL